MELSFDPAKDRLNRIKHGLSLAQAAELDWPAALLLVDRRRDYGEVRMIAYAPIGNRLYCAVYTEREGRCRLISFRKANRREFRRYASQIDSAD